MAVGIFKEAFDRGRAKKTGFLEEPTMHMRWQSRVQQGEDVGRVHMTLQQLWMIKEYGYESSPGIPDVHYRNEWRDVTIWSGDGK